MKGQGAPCASAPTIAAMAGLRLIRRASVRRDIRALGTSDRPPRVCWEAWEIASDGRGPGISRMELVQRPISYLEASGGRSTEGRWDAGRARLRWCCTPKLKNKSDDLGVGIR